MGSESNLILCLFFLKENWVYNCIYKKNVWAKSYEVLVHGGGKENFNFKWNTQQNILMYKLVKGKYKLKK